MPSGTFFTNELDSCYNEVLALAIKYLPANTHNVALQMVTDQGDDAVMIVTADEIQNFDKLADIIGELYAEVYMVVNPKKQMIAYNKAEYLKRLHIIDRVESYRSYV